MHAGLSPQTEPAVIFTRSNTLELNERGVVVGPEISIGVDVLPEEVAVDQQTQWIIAVSRKANFQVTEQPKELEVPAGKATRFTLQSPAGNTDFPKTLVHYLLKRDEELVTIVCVAKSAEMAAYMADCETTVKSFHFSPIDDIVNLRQLDAASLKLVPMPQEHFRELQQQALQAMDTARSFQSVVILRDFDNPQLASFEYTAQEGIMRFLSPESFEVVWSDYPNNTVDQWRVVGDALYIKIGFWMPWAMRSTTKEDPQFKEMLELHKNWYKEWGFQEYVDILRQFSPIGWAPNSPYTMLQFRLRLAEENGFLRPRQEGSRDALLTMWIADQDHTIRAVKTEYTRPQGTTRTSRQEHYFTKINFPFVLGQPEIPPELLPQ